MVIKHPQSQRGSKIRCGVRLLALILTTGLFAPSAYAAVGTPTQLGGPPDLIVLKNGDQLNGQFVRAIGGTVTFHNDVAGDVHIDWAKIKELHTNAKVSVIRKGLIVNRNTPAAEIPSGFLTMSDQQIVLQSDDHTTIATIPVDSVDYVVDQTTLDKELRGQPGLFQAWNGGVTASASFINATQKAYSLDGSISLVRTVPAVSWLASRNRTSLLLSGTSGKITQPAYVASDGTDIAEQITKTDIYHAGLERDQYFSPRVYYLGTVQFDHNFSQNLQLQQLYGAGLGWTTIKTPKQTLDLSANIQYVKQTFIEAQPGDNKNLVGSTISANYVVHLTGTMEFTQYAAYLPAFNQGEAYSLTERNTLALPAYKNFRIALGTTDSYLNEVAVSEPPSKRNSFQFTLGLNYDIKSSY